MRYAIVIVVCIILAIFMFINEYKRGMYRRVWRGVASLVVVLALACIILPVGYSVNKIVNEGEAVLLTDGFIKDSLEKYPGASIYTADIHVKEHYPPAKLIDLNEFGSKKYPVKKIRILGYGLTQSETEQLEGRPVEFHTVVIPEGISSINWTDKIKQGENFKVQGVFNNQQNKRLRLVLKGLATGLDSVTIPAKTISNFSLTALPKTTGPIIYQLVAIAGTDTISNENLPLFIEPIRPLKVLMLAGSPGFENKFLIRWLSENGFSVAVKAAVSKNIYSSNLVNSKNINLSVLSENLLSKFDLVISDLSTLHSLNASENSALKQGLTENGIGLIVLADTVFKNEGWEEKEMHFKKLPADENKVQILNILAANTSSKVRVSAGYFIENESNNQTIVADEKKQALVSLTIAGRGKIAFSTIAETYSWVLAGDKKDFALYWQTIIAKCALKSFSNNSWQINGGDQKQANMLNLTLLSNNKLASAEIQGLNIPVAQNDIIPYQWLVQLWPAKMGWNTIKLAGAESGEFYVYNKNDWRALEITAKISATKRFAESNRQKENVTKLLQLKTFIPVPKSYFYVLLLIAYTWLWAEGKWSRKSLV